MMTKSWLTVTEAKMMRSTVTEAKMMRSTVKEAKVNPFLRPCRLSKLRRKALARMVSIVCV
jgi:hypothetical protein